MSVNDGTGTNWAETHPGGTEPARSGATEIRDLRKGVRARLLKEHVDFADSGVGGEHLQGSAKVYVAAAAAAPTKRPDTTTNLDASDYGRLWYISDTGELQVRTAAGWTALKSSTVLDDSITLAKLNSTLVAKLNTEIQADAGTQPWCLKVGSARAYFGNYTPSGFPTTTPNGAALGINDYGRMAFDWNAPLGTRMKVWGGASWGDIAAHVVAAGIIGTGHLDGTLTTLLGIRCKSGQYGGNNTTTNQVVLGFQPDVVFFINSSTGAMTIAVRQLSTTALYVSGTGNPGGTTFQWDASGFTIKTANAAVNATGTTYGYFALKTNA